MFIARILGTRCRPACRPHLFLGWRGERAAARYLKRRGYRILARNFRRGRGEIDLIALDRDTIVFVEVKTRTTDERDGPPDVARRIQWPHIVHAARQYLRRCRAENRPCRFDVVVVSWPRRGRPIVEHFENVHAPATGRSGISCRR